VQLVGRTDIVDIDIDPLSERLRRQQTLLRIGLPLGGVGLIVGFLLGIAVYSDRANRAGVLGLSETLLHSTQQRVAQQVSAYLEPAARTTLLASSMLGHGAATDRAEDAWAFATSVLHETPQIANVLFADPAGDFMMVTRVTNSPPGGSSGATETKRILISPAGRPEGRTVEWITRDADGKVIADRRDPSDTYDARTRSWFTGARAMDGVFWSNTYIFFSARAPGVTAAVHGSGSDPDVLGVDISLDAISRFLSSLSIGRTGRAYIATKNGEMIAGPDPSHILTTKDGTLVPARIDTVGDPQLAASWDHFRAQGPGERVIESGGRKLISIVTPLAGNSQGWLLFITVPEDEFSGFLTVNSQHAALLSLVVVALAMGLAILLVRQGLRADRAARAVAERSAAVRQQSAAFARLATEVGMFDAAGKPPIALTETLAEATGARRAGIWRLSGDGHVLRCEDSYEPVTGGHVAGLELSQQEVPALIKALTAGTTIDVPDARRDRITAALHGSFMAPLGSVALFAVPVTQAGRPVGLVMLEDARRDPAAMDFTRACATLVGLGAPPIHNETDVAPRVTSPTAETAPDRAMDEQGLDPRLGGFAGTEGSRSRAVVLVLRLPDAAEAFAREIAGAVQRITTSQGVPYAKMLGTTIVAAAGYDAVTEADLTAAAIRLAETAIALREHCSNLFEADESGTAFGLGLDAGPVLGCVMGTEPNVFNLWGDVVFGATTLATSAPPDSIQVSELAYRLLRQGFLFRPRGLFHRPRIGEARSFILAGRA
jgi:adenylate cyclase